LYTFDYVITFDREVHLVWSRKASGSSILFLLFRYLTLAWITMYIAINTSTACKVCESIMNCRSDMATFIALRVYGISGGSPKVPLVVLFIGLMPPALYLTAVVTIVLSICSILDDGLVLIVTWYTTHGLNKAARQAGIEVSLVGLLLRDGKARLKELFASMKFLIIL
ncbi:hypothetical protein WOLCODRAFT_82676, partial [Wolfiporia cocos MD-104 SS10]